jgi:uncharacterized protein DUF2510
VNAGWYHDPTGRREQRYWDGSAWTDHVSDHGEQSSDAISGDYAPPRPPAPAGAWSTPASAQWQAPVATAQKKRPVWPWIIVAVAVLVFGGCTASIIIVAVAVDEAIEELNEEQRRHAITNEQFDSVPIGTTERGVMAILGKQPEDKQEFIQEGVLDESDILSSCIYYNRSGGEFGDVFQFCFENGSLTRKNAY